jgi:hypothetical protein
VPDPRTDPAWKHHHARWLRGEATSDSLLAHALLLGPGHPMSWMWAMTVIEIRSTPPSAYARITCV